MSNKAQSKIRQMEHSLVGRQMSLLVPYICDIANSYRRQWANNVHSVIQRHMKDTDLFYCGFFSLKKWKMSTIYCSHFTNTELKQKVFWETDVQVYMYLSLQWNQHVLPYSLTKNVLFSHKFTFNHKIIKRKNGK